MPEYGRANQAPQNEAPVESDFSAVQVLIFGCLHDLQRKAFKHKIDPQRTRERWQKCYFAATILSLAVEYKVKFVGDEIGYGQDSVVEDVARACGSYYSKIEMPLPLRVKHDCGDYANVVLYKVSTSLSERKEWLRKVRRCHVVREKFMFERAYEFTEAGQNQLIVCGLEHVRGLSDRFEAAGATVRIESILDSSWFDRDFWEMCPAVTTRWQRFRRRRSRGAVQPGNVSGSASSSGTNS